MSTVISEADALIDEMDSLNQFDDDMFIEYFDKAEKLQERLSAKEQERGVSVEDLKNCSDRLTEAFNRMRGKMSFCRLS